MLQQNHNGLTLNFTGNGKGKTTAALGTAIRALGWGWQVAFVQFIKSEMETGEKRFFAQYLPNIMFRQYGLGCTFLHQGNHAGAAQTGWDEVKGLLQNFTGQLLVLDEFNIAVQQGFINAQEAAKALQNRSQNLNVIITGRYAHPDILAVCDLVSEIDAAKHYLQQGIPAVKGLDL